MTELFSLFLNGLISATVLPGTSEIFFVYLLSEGLSVLNGLIAVSLGNIIGAMISFFMGWGLFASILKKKLHVNASSKKYIDRYGPAILLLSWIPILGDPLVIAAGAMRLNVIQCLIWISIGKAIRYLLLAIPFMF